METKRSWFTSKIILNEHKNLPVRQIYLWFITNDFMLPVVSGKSGNFQLPGGKPEINETHIETIKREMFEETGIKIYLEKHKPELFGYYLIENDSNWDFKPYLQIRYMLKVEENSEMFELSVNEREDDKDIMSQVKFINIKEVPEYLPYLIERDEYKIVKSYIN